MYKLLEPYGRLVAFLGIALGDNVEVALHDLTSPEQEIVAIANGNISGREIGACLSNLSIHYLETKQYEKHDYVMNYKTVGEDGKLLRSATYFIKEPGRDIPIGMLCINVNISDYEYIESTLKKILGIKDNKDIEFERDNPIEILSSPLEEMIARYMDECLETMGFPSYFLVERLNVEEKIEVVKYLSDRGTFQVKGSIPLVAEKLGVSEPTIYRYLKRI